MTNKQTNNTNVIKQLQEHEEEYYYPNIYAKKALRRFKKELAKDNITPDNPVVSKSRIENILKIALRNCPSNFSREASITLIGDYLDQNYFNK